MFTKKHNKNILDFYLFLRKNYFVITKYFNFLFLIEKEIYEKKII